MLRREHTLVGYNNNYHLQKLKYVGHVTRHFREDNNARSVSKEKQRKANTELEKFITNTFGTMAVASRVADDRHQFRTESFGQRRPDEDKLREEGEFQMSPVRYRRRSNAFSRAAACVKISVGL